MGLKPRSVRYETRLRGFCSRFARDSRAGFLQCRLRAMSGCWRLDAGVLCGWATCSEPVHPRFDHIFALPVGVLPAQAPTGAARRKSERAILGRTATLLRTDHPENPRTEGVHVLFIYLFLLLSCR